MRFLLKDREDDLGAMRGLINVALLLFYGLIIIAVVLFVFSPKAHASIFDVFSMPKKIEIETKALKDSVNKELSDIRAELGVIKDNQITLNSRIESHVNAEVNTQVKARAQVGYDKSENTDTTAGRDVSIVNDPGVLKTVVGALAATNAATMGLAGTIAVMALKARKEKKEFKQKFYELKDKKA